MSRVRPSFSFWIAAILAFPVIFTIVKFAIQVQRDDLAATIFLLTAAGPALVVIGLTAAVTYSLYRRRRAAFIILMCYVPFGLTSVLAFLPASGTADSLGYGTASSLALTLKIVGFIAFFGGIEYLIGKDLVAVNRSEHE